MTKQIKECVTRDLSTEKEHIQELKKKLSKSNKKIEKLNPDLLRLLQDKKVIQHNLDSLSEKTVELRAVLQNNKKEIIESKSERE